MLLLLVVCLAVLAGVHSATVTDVHQLPVDRNSRLTTSYLFYAASSDCAADVSNLSFDYREVRGVSDEIMQQMLKSDQGLDASRCPVVCIERGYGIDFVTDPLPEMFALDVADAQSFVTEHCQQVDLHYCNYHPNPVDVFWIDSNGRKHLQGTVSPKNIEGYGTQKTFLGHTFEFRDQRTRQLLRSITVTHETAINIGEKPPNPALSTDVDAFVSRLNETARETFRKEWERSHKVKRTFSELGFQKSKLPRDVWGSMTAYYYNNEQEAISEDWTGNGIFVNWWEQNSVITRMTHRLRDIWAARLQGLIEDWIGEPVEATSLYGMRRYQEGARLLTHVDREHTHAASLIINIAQGGIREPWKIEVYDHAYRLHEVEMQPGDIVYYESARCLHGRTKALNGSYYVNLFSHYRPLHDGDSWYLKPNPPGAPKPALDFGECSVTHGHVHCSKREDVSATLSPILQQLQGPDDLYNYWVELGGSTPSRQLQSLQPNPIHSVHEEL